MALATAPHYHRHRRRPREVTTPRDQWVRSLKQFTCDACGQPIFAGELHVRYYTFPGRNDRVMHACQRCAQGED